VDTLEVRNFGNRVWKYLVFSVKNEWNESKEFLAYCLQTYLVSCVKKEFTGNKEYLEFYYRNTLYTELKRNTLKVRNKRRNGNYGNGTGKVDIQGAAHPPGGYSEEAASGRRRQGGFSTGR
jgi:hypothetical protein